MAPNINICSHKETRGSPASPAHNRRLRRRPPNRLALPPKSTRSAPRTAEKHGPPGAEPPLFMPLGIIRHDADSAAASFLVENEEFNAVRVLVVFAKKITVPFWRN